MIVLQVALGGAIGAVLRYLCTLVFAVPMGTVFVNVVGSFLMGLAVIGLSQTKGLDSFQPAVMTGLLGGFTTFSAFSLDTLRLIESGAIAQGAAYVLGTVVLCLVAVFTGATLARMIWL